MLLERLRRKRAKAKHPTPQQAYDALSLGHCLYAPVSTCAGPPRQVGLRNRDDLAVVLACKAHTGALWHRDLRDLDNLERDLTRAFGKTGHASF
jgi:hypothetical protein